MAMDADIARAPSPAGDADEERDGPYALFESRLTIRDVADLVFTRAVRSMGAQGIAGFLMAAALLGASTGAHPDIWVPLLLLGAAIGSGFVLLPFIWWSFLSNPQLLVQTVEADTSGLIVRFGDRTLRHPWTVYRSAQETNRLFILTSRVVQPQMFTKRGVEPADVAAFRSVLDSVDLARVSDAGPRYGPLLAFLVGAVVAIVGLFATGTVRI